MGRLWLDPLPILQAIWQFFRILTRLSIAANGWLASVMAHLRLAGQRQNAGTARPNSLFWAIFAGCEGGRRQFLVGERRTNGSWLGDEISPPYLELGKDLE